MKKHTLFILFLLLILTFGLMGCGSEDTIDTQQKTSGSLPDNGQETQSFAGAEDSGSEIENTTEEKTLNSQLLMEEKEQEEKLIRAAVFTCWKSAHYQKRTGNSVLFI